MHLLITVSYLCRDRFKKQLEETHLQRRIGEFVDFYENTYKEGNFIAMQRVKPLKWIRELSLTFVHTCFMVKNKSLILRIESGSMKTNKGNLFLNVFKIKLIDKNDF